MQLLVDYLPEVWCLEEIFHHVEAVVDVPHVFQREHYPPSQHSPAHRRDGSVYDVEQRLAVFLHGLQKLPDP